MKNKVKNILFTILRFVPLTICAAFMFVYLFSTKEITAESLLNFAPEEPLFAAVFLILLYAFKSLTVFFPIVVLNVLGGFLFEPFYALLVNSVGVLVELTVPYWIGRISGTNFANKLCERHPKLRELVCETSNNIFSASFFLRVISCLPGDAVSMYLGASKTPFWKYLLGSYLGTLPGMITAILLGVNITNPSSPMFWISIGLTIITTVISFLIYYLWRKAKIKRTTV